MERGGEGMGSIERRIMKICFDFCGSVCKYTDTVHDSFVINYSHCVIQSITFLYF